jgi:hypothetical protein
VIEGVFERLIEWAAAALETSSNQPVLPRAIIALNSTELNIDEELWDVEVATRQLLDSLAETVHRNSCFKKYAQFWKDRDRQIQTLEQLVLSYYSSVEVSGPSMIFPAKSKSNDWQDYPHPRSRETQTDSNTS